MKRSVYLWDLHLVAKYFLFKYRSKMWESLNIRAVNCGACVLGCHTRLENGLLG